jgi:hypothetical protein
MLPLTSVRMCRQSSADSYTHVQTKQKLYSHRVVLQRHKRCRQMRDTSACPESKDCNFFAYELHAHPKVSRWIFVNFCSCISPLWINVCKCTCRCNRMLWPEITVMARMCRVSVEHVHKDQKWAVYIEHLHVRQHLIFT